MLTVRYRQNRRRLKIFSGDLRVRHETERQDTIDRANSGELVQIARLRIIVGYLGEKGQFNWWATSFISSVGANFLSPVFSKTVLHAQYHGVTEAARRVHDEHIGIGRVFHLFRLPEVVEQSVSRMLQDDTLEDVVQNECGYPDHAMESLRSIAGRMPALQEGPVQIGDTRDLDSTQWLSSMAGAYFVAFTAEARTYPYLRGTEG